VPTARHRRHTRPAAAMRWFRIGHLNSSPLLVYDADVLARSPHSSPTTPNQAGGCSYPVVCASCTSTPLPTASATSPRTCGDDRMLAPSLLSDIATLIARSFDQPRAVQLPHRQQHRERDTPAATSTSLSSSPTNTRLPPPDQHGSRSRRNTFGYTESGIETLIFCGQAKFSTAAISKPPRRWRIRSQLNEPRAQTMLTWPPVSILGQHDRDRH